MIITNISFEHSLSNLFAHVVYFLHFHISNLYNSIKVQQLTICMQNTIYYRSVDLAVKTDWISGIISPMQLCFQCILLRMIKL